MNTARGIRQALATLYNDLLEDKISESKARALSYIASIMLRAVESSELEDRLDQLEERIDGKG